MKLKDLLFRKMTILYVVIMFFLGISFFVSLTYYIGSKYDSTDICNNKELEKVNVNTAPANELTTVNGITSSIANSIVSWRLEHDMFNTLEDLLDVYGIGTATYRKIRNFVVLHE